VYIAGPSARSYVEESIFTGVNVKLSWFDYAGCPEYPQLWGEFIHGAAILDPLFHCGKDAHRYMGYVGA
jgi:hypothetical protein